MDDTQLCQLIAAALGADVEEATRSALRSSSTRSLSEWIEAVAPSVACGQLIADVVRLFLELKRDAKAQDVHTLLSAMAVDAKPARSLDAAQRAVLIYLAIDQAKQSGQIGNGAKRSLSDDGSTEMPADFMMRALTNEALLQHQDGTRGFFRQALHFGPFADMDYYYVLRPFHWRADTVIDGRAVSVDVPVGFVTDLASVPRPFWSILSPAGKHGQAAIFHDWLYWDQKESRDIADLTFSTIMKDIGVSLPIRVSITKAVEHFGRKFWDQNTLAKANGERRVLKELPNDPRITWNQWKAKKGVFR